MSVSTSTLTFTTTTWDTPQAVAVTAVNDAVVEGVHAAVITHTAGGGYAGVSIRSVEVAVIDNDTGSVTIEESRGSTNVTEGGETDSYSVVLDAPPSVTVTIAVGPDSQTVTSASSLTFTTTTWETPQTVTVIAHVASGGGYGGAAIPNVVARIRDDDTGGFTITQSGGSTNIAEGGTSDAYTVVLDTRPSGAVNIAITPDPQLQVSPTALTFTISDWDVPQTVTVSAVDDRAIEGTQTGVISHSASGSGFDAVVAARVVASIVDNDEGSVTIRESGGSTGIAEGGATDTYTLVLGAQPPETVTVRVIGDAQVSVSPSTLTFTGVDWDRPQTVTVRAVDDAILEGGHTGTIVHVTTGVAYDGVSIPDVTVAIDDDDASVTVVESEGGTDVAEGGVTDTFSVVLDVQPPGTVTVEMTSDGQVSVSPSSLTFTASDWDTPQTVTVTAVDDPTGEGAHTAIVGLSAGGAYEGVSIPDLRPNIADNDAAVSMDDPMAPRASPRGATLTRTPLRSMRGRRETSPSPSPETPRSA